jgi:hypothetical protein
MLLIGKVTGCETPPPHRLRFYRGYVIVAETMTDAAGHFSVQLPAGEYTVTCDGKPCKPSPIRATPGVAPIELLCCPKGSCGEPA